MPNPFYFVLDRKPGDIESITDLFLEDFKNFLQTRGIGEKSARFVWEEMEKMWGDARMAVLAEDEAQPLMIEHCLKLLPSLPATSGNGNIQVVCIVPS